MGGPLYISRDAEADWLTALPLGRLADGQPETHYRHVGDGFRWCLDGPAGHAIGFEVITLRAFDPDEPVYAELWTAPRFDVPLLALTGATAGEIIVAARGRYAASSTLNRVLFDRAITEEPAVAVETWRLCLEAGGQMAHYGLGRTLLELGRAHEAYAHLREYARIVPEDGWAWCFLGRACCALGVTEEARQAFGRALELEREGGFVTDAAALLDELAAPRRSDAR
jgi:tetratricopeptide (TPR) repeat protein